MVVKGKFKPRVTCEYCTREATKMGLCQGHYMRKEAGWPEARMNEPFRQHRPFVRGRKRTHVAVRIDESVWTTLLMVKPPDEPTSEFVERIFKEWMHSRTKEVKLKETM
jgi:hypothetical protein